MAGVDYSKFGQPRPNTGIFRPPQYIEPSLPSLPAPTDVAAAVRGTAAIAKPWWDAAGKYADSMPTKHLITSGGPQPVNPFGGTPNPMTAQGATPGPYNGQSLAPPPRTGPPDPYESVGSYKDLGSEDSPFAKAKAGVSGMIGKLGNWINSDPLGTQANAAAGVANARPLTFGGPPSANAMVPPVGAETNVRGPGNPADAAQGVVGYQPPPPNFMTGGGFGTEPPGGVTGATGNAGVPMPRPRPDDMTTPPPALSQADPSKIIMYGTPDNPGQAIDWRSIFGNKTGGLY